MKQPLQLGTGWRREAPSPADRHARHADILPHLEALGVHHAAQKGARLPARMDLRQWAPPVRFQGG